MRTLAPGLSNRWGPHVTLGSTCSTTLEVTTPRDEALLDQDTPGQCPSHPVPLLTQYEVPPLGRPDTSHGTNAPTFGSNSI